MCLTLLCLHELTVEADSLPGCPSQVPVGSGRKSTEVRVDDRQMFVNSLGPTLMDRFSSVWCFGILYYSTPKFGESIPYRTNCGYYIFTLAIYLFTLSMIMKRGEIIVE